VLRFIKEIIVDFKEILLILGLYSSEQEGHNPYKGRETYTGSCEGMYYNYFCQLCV